MSILKWFIKGSEVVKQIALATPDIIAIFTAYREAKKDDKLTYAEIKDLFDRLISVIIRINPNLEKYL